MSNNMNKQNYSYVDLTSFEDVEKKEIYYRLKMTDKDGTFAYSRIEHLLFKYQNELVFFPNPATDYIYFDAANFKSLVDISLINSKGQNVAKDQKLLNGYINTKGLIPGLYFLKAIRLDNSILTQKVLINR